MAGMICILALLNTLLPGPAPRAVTPLVNAHAHNDYRHDPPLLKALQHGFASVEADVFLVGDELLVAHGPGEITPERTLRSLYLEPLRERVRRNDGRVYPDGGRFLLLVDVKSAVEPTWQRLHEVLKEYRDMLTTFGPQTRRDKAVLVVVSGNRSLELMASQPVRYAGYDGRLADLDSDASAEIIPLISDRWGTHFTWSGDGPMPPEERRKLGEIVQKAHAKDRLVRFWATPDQRSPAREALWRELLSAGVDLINTDDLGGLKEFLLRYEY